MIVMGKKYKCITKYCRNKIESGMHCSTCRSQFSRSLDPERYAYNTLRANSKRRGIPFNINITQFRKFCRKTNYIAGKGRKRDSYTIDRIDPNKGYIIGNIQILTLSQNASKGSKTLHYDWKTKWARITESIPQQISGPF